MSSTNYGCIFSPRPPVSCDLAMKTFENSSRFLGKPMCLSALDCGSQITCSRIDSLISLPAIGQSQSALRHNHLRAGTSRLYGCASSTFHSAFAAKWTKNISCPKKVIPLPAINAATSDISDTTPSALSNVPIASKSPLHSPPPFCLAVYTMNFLLVFSMLPDPSLDGHLSTSAFAQTLSSTPIASALPAPDLPWHPLSVPWIQNEKSEEFVRAEAALRKATVKMGETVVIDQNRYTMDMVWLSYATRTHVFIFFKSVEFVTSQNPYIYCSHQCDRGRHSTTL